MFVLRHHEGHGFFRRVTENPVIREATPQSLPGCPAGGLGGVSDPALGARSAFQAASAASTACNAHAPLVQGHPA